MALLFGKLALELSCLSRFQPLGVPEAGKNHDGVGCHLDLFLRGKPCRDTATAYVREPQAPASLSPASWLPSSGKPSLVSPTHMHCLCSSAPGGSG